MIVNRRTFVAKRGKIREVTELLTKVVETANLPGAARIYIPEIAPFDVVVTETEFEDWDQYHKFWAEWDPGEAFWQKWFALTENGGTNEVWRLAE